MKPVLVLQHLDADGPAYLGTWLQAQGVPFEVLNTQRGQDFPEHIEGYGALAVLGGPMSANDPLPSLRRAEALIREAMAQQRPVIGHCLGGQLMARALGARVAASPAPEIGWQPLTVLDDPLARQWFGPEEGHTVMHWHYEAFDLPPGARWLATSEACAHQAFAIGPHLAMQFHIEIDAPKLHRWLAEDDPRWHVVRPLHASVQDQASMLQAASRHLVAHMRLADRLYERWLAAAA